MKETYEALEMEVIAFEGDVFTFIDTIGTSVDPDSATGPD